MGGAKDAMVEHADNLAAATTYLVSIGMLQVCDYHGMVYGGGFMKLEGDFYARAMNDRNKGDRGPIPWARYLDAREYTDLLVKAYEEHCASECTHPSHGPDR